MTRFLALFTLCFSTACTFNPSAFVCEEGEALDATRDCKDGVWVQRVPTSTTDVGEDARLEDLGDKDVLPQPGCGDSQIDAGEKCDGKTIPQTCVELGFASGEIACGSDCEYDTSKCEAPPTCNNGVLDMGEECDPSVFDGQDKTCSAAFDSGEVSCTDACRLDISECSRCGNGVLEGAEECDGPVLDVCDKDGEAQCVECKVDKSGCFECGNGQLESKEVCDTTEFNGLTCESLNGAGSLGELRCEDDCQTVNDSDCGVKYVQVSAGRFHTCGLQSDGRIRCWGENVPKLMPRWLGLNR